MSAIDKSVVVGTLYDCEVVKDFDVMVFNSSWRHNMIGCVLIDILKNMYKLNITYVYESVESLQFSEHNVDLFAVPFVLAPDALNLGHPIQAVIHARHGFLVRRPHDIGLWNHYYSRPFTLPLWRFLLVVAVVVGCLFFLAAWWEKRLLGEKVECSIGLEILLILGGYCQHIPSVEAIFTSRRTAHFTFFLYCYIIYTVYTSNLLSHLVIDKERDIGLDYLESECFEFAVLENMQHILTNNFYLQDNHDIYDQLSRAETMLVMPALNAVRFNRTALLSDYITVYPLIQAAFTDIEICELLEVDLNSDVMKYIFASSRFTHSEQLKIGTLRAREAGILKRLTHYDDYYPLKCETVLHQEVKIQHVFIPSMILLVSYAVSFLIMLLERLHYEETRVWTYVD